MWSGAAALGRRPTLACFATLWIPSSRGKPPGKRAISLRSGSARTEALSRNTQKHHASQLTACLLLRGDLGFHVHHLHAAVGFGERLARILQLALAIADGDKVAAVDSVFVD